MWQTIRWCLSQRNPISWTLTNSRLPSLFLLLEKLLVVLHENIQHFINLLQVLCLVPRPILLIRLFTNGTKSLAHLDPDDQMDEIVNI